MPTGECWKMELEDQLFTQLLYGRVAVTVCRIHTHDNPYQNIVVFQKIIRSSLVSSCFFHMKVTFLGTIVNTVQSVLWISRKPPGTYFTGYFLGTIPLVSHQERPLEPSWIPNLHVKKHGISRSHPGYLLKVSGITPGT